MRWLTDEGDHPLHGQAHPNVEVDYLDLSERGHKGLGVSLKVTLEEGQSIHFALREPPKPETSGTGADIDCELCHARIRLTTLLIQIRARLLGIPEHTNGGDTRATSAADPPLDAALFQKLHDETVKYWLTWLSKCTYTGRWREIVQRSALALKVCLSVPPVLKYVSYTIIL